MMRYKSPALLFSSSFHFDQHYSHCKSQERVLLTDQCNNFQMLNALFEFHHSGTLRNLKKVEQALELLNKVLMTELWW